MRELCVALRDRYVRYGSGEPFRRRSGCGSQDRSYSSSAALSSVRHGGVETSTPRGAARERARGSTASEGARGRVPALGPDVPPQYQPTDSEWAHAPHGLPYRPAMYSSPHEICVAGLVSQSEPCVAIFSPGSAWGMP